MTRARAIRFLLIPVLVGLVATLFVYRQLSTQAARTRKEMVAVVVTTRAVPAKTRLETAMLSTVAMPKEFVNSQALTNLSDAVDRITMVPLAEGEILLKAKLASSDTRAGMAYRIPPGRRAMAVGVNEIIGVAGMLQPGDAVDVLAIFSKQTIGQDKGRLILENLPVLAVGRETAAQSDSGASASSAGRSGYGTPSQGARGSTTVTLAVTPQEAVLLALAEEKAVLRLMLRPALDDTIRGIIDFTTDVFVQAQPVDMIFEAKRQVRFNMMLVEIDTAALATLAAAEKAGDGASAGTLALWETSRQLWEKVLRLIASGEARELARSDLMTMNRQQVRYRLAGQVPVTNRSGGLEIPALGEFGITVELMPVVYNRPFIDITARVVLRILDLGSAGPFATERVGELTVRLDRQNELLAVTGLLTPGDFSLPPKVTTRHILPGGLISEAVSAGTRRVILLILPEVDQR
jgi:pilus assembly protein CpaB